MASPIVSSDKIAGLALRHVGSAQAEILDGTYSSAAAARIELRLNVVSELLELITDTRLPREKPTKVE